MEFNFSMDVAPPSQHTAPTGPRYASDDGIVYSISDEECLFLSRRTGENHVMTRDVLMAMSQTRDLHTLSAHVEAIARAQPALAKQREAIRKVLEAMVSRGIMVSEQELIEQLSAGDVPDEAAPFSALVIRSCDRSESLGRLLESLQDDAEFAHAGFDVLVADDSRSEANRRSNRELSKRFGARYFGVDEQARFVTALAKKTGVPDRALSVLLNSRPEGVFSGGRLLNLISLLLAGTRFALLDDDLLYTPLRRKTAEPDLLSIDAQAAVEVDFAEDLDALAQLGEKPEVDLLSWHLRFCGQPLTGVLAWDSWQQTRIDNLNVSGLRHASPGGRVILTQQGVWGHSPSDKPFWLYALGKKSRAGFVADRDAYMRNRSTPWLWRSTQQTMLHRQPRLLPLTVDASQLLPPTLAEGRAEDLLFNVLVMALYPDAFTLEAPFALAHGRGKPHSYTDRQRQEPMTPGLATLLADFVEARIGQCEAESAEHRFAWILAQISDLLAASPQRRELFLREYLGWVRGDFIGQLQEQLASDGDLPVYWQADAQAMIKSNAKALLAGDMLALDDTPGGLSGEAAIEHTFARLRDWVDAAAHWPALYRAAHSEASLEQRLAQG